MDEETEVLAFPNLKLSELEAGVETARNRLFDRIDKTRDAAIQTFHPANLLRHHKGPLVAGGALFLLLGKLFGSVTRLLGPKVQSSAILSGLVKTGWMWKALALSYQVYKFVSKKKQ